MIEKFWYKEIDINHLLPPDWDKEIIKYALKNKNVKHLIPSHSSSRESSKVESIKVATVGGLKIANDIPWLYEFYKNDFKNFGEEIINAKMNIASDKSYALNLNIQEGKKMRYECHVDTNPLECLLYVTDHPKGNGGELVVAMNTDAENINEVDKNCKLIYPKKGYLVYFDARFHPHYVRPLLNDNGIRIVVAMNYYTAYWDESRRPNDLSSHLGINKSKK
jgi:hypothetical protein